MPKNSDGLMLVWNVAAMEAIQAGAPFIEPGQLLVALCKIGDLPPFEANGSPKRSARLQLEVTEVEEIFALTKLDVRHFRRRLRAELGRGSAPEQKIIHRSPARWKFLPALKISAPITR